MGSGIDDPEVGGDALWILMMVIGVVLLVLILTHNAPPHHCQAAKKCHVHPHR
jgi:hypothetical protein